MKKTTLLLICLISLSWNLIAQEKKERKFESLWEGKLKIGSVSLRLVLKTFLKDDGTLGAFLDSPDQGAKDIPVTFASVTDDSLKFKIDMIGATYNGKIEKDSLVVVGNFSQAGMNLPLNLKKVEKVAEILRPQNPQKPYPYNEEEVVIENRSANIKLGGTFTFPGEEKKYPAVVLVTGSGSQDRDETIFNHKPFWIIADYLTRNGIAVLRYDDRGIGKSGGDPSTATTADFVTDVIASVEYLKTKNEIDQTKIGIIGHSEGGMIAPMAVSLSDDIAFIVLLAGPGLTGKDILIKQTELILKAEGTKEEELAKQVNRNKKIYNIIANEPDSLTAYHKLEELYNLDFAQMSEEEKKDPTNSRDVFERNVKIILSPWFRFFLKFDPKLYLETVTVPVLAMNGEKDLQVPPKENLSAIDEALKTAGNKNYKIVELPGLNHLFQTCKTCTVSEYGQIEETFSPEALKIIGDWINDITK
ncbi:MAG: alpha/beta fold hydrolase [Bacteroidota bacterium]